MTVSTWLRRTAATSAFSASVLLAVATPSLDARADDFPSTAQSVPPEVVPGTELKPKPPPWVMPVASYEITGEYGDVSYYWSSAHTGLDFAAPSGTPIRSIGPGVVKSAGWDGSYGYKTVVELPDGSVVWYCHQDSVAVEVGQQLAPGEVLGHVGSSGNVTGAHLHLEHHYGDEPSDPYVLLAEHGLSV
ncbi:MAG: M23 family metallopeptidase [Nocardioides sp.]